MTTDPNYYREKAEQTLRLAARKVAVQNRPYLLEVAQRYEILAVEAEQKLSVSYAALGTA
jgi:hypothetical protein